MKIVLFARTLRSTRLCKISQESGLLFNFSSLPKIRNARFGRCGPTGVKNKHAFMLDHVDVNTGEEDVKTGVVQLGSSRAPPFF